MDDSGKAECPVCGRIVRYSSTRPRDGSQRPPTTESHNYPSGHSFDGARCHGSLALVTVDGAKNGAQFTAKAVAS